ncbi:MAG: thioredoxin family protein [Flavitalea sp.]
MKYLLLVTLLFFNSEKVEWGTDLNKAMQTAALENKQIILNFSGSDWCIPCIKMHKEIFDSEPFNELAGNKLVLVNADFPRSKKNKPVKELQEANEKLAEKYNNKGIFPLTLLLDKDGNVLKSWEGYVKTTPQDFVQQIQTSINEHHH